MTTFMIPNKVLSNQEGYQYIASLYCHESNAVKDIILDFKYCYNFDANLSAVLGAIADSYYNQGGSVYVQNMSVGVRKALSRNGFLSVLKPEEQLEEKENYVPYNRFKRSAADEFKRYIDDWVIAKSKFPKHTKLAGEKISETLYELFVNAITHGQSQYVYSCGEHFNRNGNNRLCITIVDMGVTIPANVNQFLQKESNAVLEVCEAIQWAFVCGNTTKDTPGGLGLALLQDFIRQNEGAMQMISADGMLEYRNGRISTQVLSHSFPGTIVNLEFNFDDPKNYFMRSELKDSADLL